jgi:endonuclease YncB( thermonuclease family)
MVDRGLAVAYRDYSLKYVPNEEQAKAAKRGKLTLAAAAK